MAGKFGKTGLITGGIVAAFALLLLVTSGAGDNTPAMHTYLVCGAIIFGCGLIACAIEGKKPE